MEEVRGQVTEDVIKLFLAGHIDSNNAAAAEAEIASILGDAAARPMVIDASDLVYISSAGLRMILRLRKKFGPQVESEEAMQKFPLACQGSLTAQQKCCPQWKPEKGNETTK